MNKKNRFSMLEVDVEKGQRQVESNVQDSLEGQDIPKRVLPKEDITVVIPEENFKNNLERHKLKMQQKEIKRRKIIITKESEIMKASAYIKIYLGLAIILYVVVRTVVQYVMYPDQITDLDIAKQVAIIVVGILVQIYFGRNNKKDRS